MDPYLIVPRPSMSPEAAQVLMAPKGSKSAKSANDQTTQKSQKGSNIPKGLKTSKDFEEPEPKSCNHIEEWNDIEEMEIFFDKIAKEFQSELQMETKD